MSLYCDGFLLNQYSAIQLMSSMEYGPPLFSVLLPESKMALSFFSLDPLIFASERGAKWSKY